MGPLLRSMTVVVMAFAVVVVMTMAWMTIAMMVITFNERHSDNQ